MKSSLGIAIASIWSVFAFAAIGICGTVQASEKVQISAAVDYKACVGKPDEATSKCSGAWSTLTPLEIELVDVTEGGPGHDSLSYGRKIYFPVINGVQFQGAIIIEKWERDQKSKYHVEVRVGRDLEADSVISTDLYLTSLKDLNPINVMSAWENDGDHYAKEIVRIGPAIQTRLKHR